MLHLMPSASNYIPVSHESAKACAVLIEDDSSHQKQQQSSSSLTSRGNDGGGGVTMKQGSSRDPDVMEDDSSVSHGHILDLQTPIARSSSTVGNDISYSYIFTNVYLYISVSIFYMSNHALIEWLGFHWVDFFCNIIIIIIIFNHTYIIHNIIMVNWWMYDPQK